MLKHLLAVNFFLGVLCLLVSLLMGCASSQFTTSSQSASEGFLESSADTKNRAPASMSLAQASIDGTDPESKAWKSSQADYHYSLGEALSNNGEYERAIEEFQLTLVYDPGAASVHTRLSAELIRVGSITKALSHAETATQKDPQSVDAHLLLAGLYSTLKMYPKAVEVYKKILKIDSLNKEAPLYLGAILAEQKKYDEAIKYFEQLLKARSYKNDAMIYYYIGKIRIDEFNETKAQKAGQLAVKALEQAIEKKPDLVEAVISLANWYEKNDQEDKAIGYYQKYQKEHGPSIKIAEILANKYLESEKFDLAYDQLLVLESQSDDPLNAKVKIALILIERKDFDQAVSKLKEILELAPESDKIRFYLGAVYEETKQYQLAVEEYAKLTTASSFYDEAIVHQGYLLKQMKNYKKARAHLEQALEERKDIPQLYSLLASVLEETKEYDKAIEVLKPAIERFPDNVQIRFYHASLYDKKGDKEKMLIEMKKVLAMDPNHIQALNYLAYSMAEMDLGLEDAEKMARRALAFEPADGFILDTLGWVLFKKGNSKEAIRYLEAAFKKQPEESTIAEHLGDAYYQNQLTEKAKRMYQRAMEVEVDASRKQELRSKISAIDRQESDKSRLPASLPQGKVTSFEHSKK